MGCWCLELHSLCHCFHGSFPLHNFYKKNSQSVVLGCYVETLSLMDYHEYHQFASGTQRISREGPGIVSGSEMLLLQELEIDMDQFNE